MAKKTILATYVNGVFRPVDPEALQLSEGQKVELTGKPVDRATYILGLARQVYEGLNEDEIAAIEEAIRRRPLFSEEADEKQPQDQTA